MDEYGEQKKRGNLILENRQRLSVSAVCDVESFEPERIVLVTNDGILTVTGRNMHVKKLSSESGEALIEGEVCGCVYSATAPREGFFKRVLR